MPPRIVITGLGVVTAFGVGAQPLWEGLLAGQSRLRPIRRFDASGFPSRLAGEVEGFSARDLVPKSYRKAVKVMARDIELAVGAAKAAVEDAGLVTKAAGTEESPASPTYPSRRVGCHIGAGLISCEVDELTTALATARDPERGNAFSYELWGGKGLANLQPLWLLKYLPNMLACHVTIIHDAQGPSNTITCAEASGLLSMGESKRVIERGEADMCFSGGAESKVTPMGLVRMDMAGRLAHTGGSEDGASFVRPYDPGAGGGLLGEAAGLVALENEETARARGARVYAELAGFGGGQSPRTGDDERRSAGLRYAIENALEDAGVAPGEIDAIVPHASGVRSLDAQEAAALRRVFGARLKDVPLVTVTPAIGEGMAGAGAVGACVGALCVRHQALPARIHAGSPAPDLQAGPARQRDARLRHVLVCTNALGGQNAAIVLRSARAT
jgi:3-oxoacyl-[acyl-carrier-protein] synthase II